MFKGTFGALRRSSYSLLCIAFALVIIAFQGVAHIRYIGALSMPDPNMHALGAYALASGQSFNETVPIRDEYGNERVAQVLEGEESFLVLPECRNDLITTILSGGLANLYDAQRIPQIEASASSHDHIEIPFDLADVDGRDEGWGRSTQYFPLAWLPSAIGIKAAMTFGLSGYDAFQWGRVSNLIVYMGLMATAIALIPKMKPVLALLAIAPPAVFCASSLMCDGFSRFSVYAIRCPYVEVRKAPPCLQRGAGCACWAGNVSRASQGHICTCLHGISADFQ